MRMATGRDITLEEVSSICSTLDAILRPGFGPNGLNTLLTTSTGQMMVAKDSWTILNSITLSHPIGCMITNSVKTHVKHYGDGGKTFILILSEIFKGLTGSSLRNERQKLVWEFIKLKDNLPSLLTEVISDCPSLDLCNSDVNTVKKLCQSLIMAQLLGSFPKYTSEHLCSILLKLLFDGLTDVAFLPSLIVDVLDNFSICCLEAVGYPATSSQVIEGFVIQREFQSTAPVLSSKSQIRVLLVSCSLDGEDDNGGVVYNVDNESSLHSALSYKNKLTYLVVRKLVQDGIDLVISSVSISRHVNIACHAENISTVHMVDEEDMARLSMLFGILPIHSLHEYLVAKHVTVGVISRCGYILIGGHRFVHLVPDVYHAFINQNKDVQLMKHLLITGHSRGACCQIRTVLQNCMKCLRTLFTLDAQIYLQHGTASVTEHPKSVSEHPKSVTEHPKYLLSITTSATFELYMYFKLNSIVSAADDVCFAFVSKLFARALLQVPLLLQNNSCHPLAKSLNVVNILKDTSKKNIAKLQINPQSGRLTVANDSNGAENVVSKITMLYNIIDLVVQMLRIDKLVPVQMS